MEVLASINTIVMYFSAEYLYQPKEAMPNLQYASEQTRMKSGNGPTKIIQSVMAR
jgi:hypothetical protein